MSRLIIFIILIILGFYLANHFWNLNLSVVDFFNYLVTTIKTLIQTVINKA